MCEKCIHTLMEFLVFKKSPNVQKLLTIQNISIAVFLLIFKCFSVKSSICCKSIHRKKTIVCLQIFCRSELLGYSIFTSLDFTIFLKKKNRCFKIVFTISVSFHTMYLYVHKIKGINQLTIYV